MTMRSAAEKRFEMCTRLAYLRGGSAARYFLDASRCSDVYGASPENYFVLRFFELSDRQRGEYLTSGRSRRLDRLLNAGASGWEREALGRKDIFDRVFSSLLNRDRLYVPDASPDEIADFLARHGEVMAKPVRGTQGSGIRRVDAADLRDRDAFLFKCAEDGILLEEVITQHPVLAAVTPDCVSTVRVSAARGRDGLVRFIGAALRCGGPGASADNFHSGGAAYPLDMDTGRVTGPGRDNTSLTAYVRHPGSGAFMPGLCVPHWGETLETVRRAMDIVPGMGYVGWDIAETPAGPELIEGNFGYPGGNIIQFDGRGKYPLLLECAGENYDKGNL